MKTNLGPRHQAAHGELRVVMECEGERIKVVNEIFYMIDGMPSHNYQFVRAYLISRKIKEINNIGINQAIAIWGKREGKNGVIQIKTFDKGDTVIPIIIK